MDRKVTTPQLRDRVGAVHVHNIDTSWFSENRKSERENKGKVGRHVLRFGFVAAMICVGNADQPTTYYEPNREYFCPRESIEADVKSRYCRREGVRMHGRPSPPQSFHYHYQGGQIAVRHEWNILPVVGSIQSVAGVGGISYAIIMTHASTAACADQRFERQDTF